MLLGLGGLTALFIVIAPLDHARRSATASSPSVSRACCSRSSSLLGLSGIIVGILNSYDQFTVPALTSGSLERRDHRRPVIGVPRAHGIEDELYVYAFSILIATVIQFLLPIPWLRGRDGRLQRRHRLARSGGSSNVHA